MKHGRKAIGIDIRDCRGALETARRRISRPHAPVKRGNDAPLPLFDVSGATP